MTKHEVSRQVMRELIYRSCRKAIMRAQAADETRREQHCAVAMNRRVPGVSRDGVFAVSGVDAFEVLSHLVKRFVPADAFPTLRSAANRMSEAILVEVNILQRNSFGTDVSAAERVILVAADVQATICFNRDLDATDRFAEMAVAIVKRHRRPPWRA